MARTRAQAKAGNVEGQQIAPGKRANDGKDQGTVNKKQKQKQGASPKSPPTVTGHDDKTSKVNQLIDRYGSLPLSDTSISTPLSVTPSTLLALLLNALLSSARISHELAARTVQRVIRAGYHDLPTLKQSTWQGRTEVLTEGGYTRYREKTATALGELAEFLSEKYGSCASFPPSPPSHVETDLYIPVIDGDLNNLLSRFKSAQDVRKGLKEIKGLGDVGVDIFFNTAQGVCPTLAPFLDPRSAKTAEDIGVGSDVEKLWRQVGESPERMCRLAGALTFVRLNGREAEFR